MDLFWTMVLQEKRVPPPDETAIAALADFYDRFQEAAVHTIKSNAEVIHFDAT